MSHSKTHWVHKNLAALSYAQDGTAGPAKEARQALSDWNRQITSDKCCYYINGVKLSEVRQGVPFQDEEEIKKFFKENFFSQYSASEQIAIAEHALKHFHQAGLPHATNFCLSNTSRSQFKPSEPMSRIDFNASPNGLVIKEENIYKQIADLHSGRRDTIPDNSEKFHAKTNTTYLFSPQGIGLVDLEIDCPNKKISDIFDKRSLVQKVVGYITNLFSDIKARLQGIKSNSNEPAVTQEAKEITKFTP